MENTEKLNAENIRKYLTTSFIGKKLVVLDSVDSTNNYALSIIKKEINAGAKVEPGKINGTVIAAEMQTSGKGRFERKWFSPPGGLWFSILLTPEIPLKDLSNISIITAAAVAAALDKHYGILVNIKWPNDIYYQSKKLAGILTETECINNILYMVIGIGININNPLLDIKLDIIKNAISCNEILGKQVERNFLLAKILSSFEEKYSYFLNTRDFKGIFNSIAGIIVY